MFEKFGLVMVVVSDMTRSVAFYRDVLGLPLRYQTPEWSEFDVGGVGLGLHLAGPHLPVNPQVGISFGFYTNDIAATVAELTGRGATIARQNEEEFGTLVEIQDPDGYTVQICQMK